MTPNSVTLISPAFWASLVVSLALHESAHLAMAYVAGVRVKHIGLSWKGPYIVREPGTPVQNTFISLAGPGHQFSSVCTVLAFIVDVRMGERVLGPGEFVAGTFVRWPACLSDLETPRVNRVVPGYASSATTMQLHKTLASGAQNRLPAAQQSGTAGAPGIILLLYLAHFP